MIIIYNICYNLIWYKKKPIQTATAKLCFYQIYTLPCEEGSDLLFPTD